ncbi:ribonuclease Z [Aureibacter tunicatorum]|uniref:Ribonuclease Z n=1 Tax=Aureibacter tunicatorum TaxID=866807 RepID=A0AAE3XPL3_9BACT|nr:ribonuclease Z [Aureibacter tunicatorum]MDR6239714.1 ribonuclease Z [Aureibacter tunicatorum]BDD04190.1 ribonuclease Z [Aureibacter tunicatorum]
MKLTILGSSSAAPTLTRHHTSQYLEIANKTFLVDCGEAAQIQLRKYRCKISKISRIFISHLHGDHYFGLIGLISSMHLYNNIEELHIHGPAGLDEIIRLQLKYSQSFLKFKLFFHATNPDQHDILYEDDNIVVSSFPLLHRVPCTGFLFKEKPKYRRLIKDKIPDDITLEQIATLKKGGDIIVDGNVKYSNIDYTRDAPKSHSYAYCSDTIFRPEISEYFKGVELLYHEATFDNEFANRAAKTFHSTAAQAAKIATLANAENLIIGHFSARYKELDTLLVESKQEFERVMLAEEGKTYLFQD